MSITTPTTELEAVNAMLSTIGEAPVSSLASGLLDAETAETILNDVSREVQSMGWNFNTEEDFPASPNDSNEIVLPAEIVRADLAQSQTKFRSTKEEYVQRGNRMYDKITHKWCNRCSHVRLRSEFGNAKTTDGLNSNCKICKADQKRIRKEKKIAEALKLKNNTQPTQV